MKAFRNQKEFIYDIEVGNVVFSENDKYFSIDDTLYELYEINGNEICFLSVFEDEKIIIDNKHVEIVYL